MLGSLVVIGIALPFIAMITLGLLKERTEKHGKTDSWFARFTAIVAAGIYGSLCTWISATCSEPSSTCGSPGDETPMLPLLASPLLFWALPKFHRWITRS